MEEQVLSAEQMLKLLELGIDVSKASMCWSYDDENARWILIQNWDHRSYIKDYDIPTFTLQDILEKMLPERIYYGGDAYILCTLRHTDISYRKATDIGLGIKVNVSSNSLLDAAFNLLKWCKQNNYI